MKKQVYCLSLDKIVAVISIEKQSIIRLKLELLITNINIDSY